MQEKLYVIAKKLKKLFTAHAIIGYQHMKMLGSTQDFFQSLKKLLPTFFENPS